MKNFKNNINTVCIILIIIFALLLIIKPEICATGIIKGILLCGRVIIPSLFPFTFCVLFILKGGILKESPIFSVITRKVFGISSEAFLIALLSFVGGYPLGAKLLNEALCMKKISPKTAENMLFYCVNAGPAFVISAVGSGILGSQKIGVILFLSNMSATFFIGFLLHKKMDTYTTLKTHYNYINAADNFVLSASSAATSVMGVCGFIILFSGINEYIAFLSNKIKILKVVLYLSEVTNAVAHTKNIFLISFLLGFGGISVWCQVLAVSGKIKVNYKLFIIFRIFHGALSAGISFLIFKIFKISVPTFSNMNTIKFEFFNSTAAVAISCFVMCIVFVISLSTKKFAGKITDDVV